MLEVADREAAVREHSAAKVSEARAIRAPVLHAVSHSDNVRSCGTRALAIRGEHTKDAAHKSPSISLCLARARSRVTRPSFTPSSALVQ